MKKAVRVLLILLGCVLAALIVGPFLVPVPALEDTVPPEVLADPDSRFMEVKGLQVHYKISGTGEPVFLLLHGFGASLFSWREVSGPLTQQGTVVAFDRPAFGLSERLMRGEWSDENPYTFQFQVELTLALMDALGLQRAILVGNSAGGAISVQVALDYPDRAEALILVDPAIYEGGGPFSWLRPFFDTPQMRRIGPLIARQIRSWGPRLVETAWHDPSKLSPEVLEGYEKPLRARNWDRALWELTAASRPSDLASRLSELTLPILVITGDDDRIVPTEQSIRLASELPEADLVVIPDCGHVPQEECPEAFLEAVSGFVGVLPVP